MRDFGKGELLSNGDIYIEFHRFTEEEFEMWELVECIGFED